MIEFTNVYRPARAFEALGPNFSDPVAPKAFAQPRLRWSNQRAADSLGLVQLDEQDWLKHFCRFEALPDGMPQPRAMRYHGHQFQVYNPDLGDGRGFLFAQLYEAGSGRLLDLATKGSGKTPYARGADGCLTLKGGVREVLAAEMLEALGVPTSRAFCLVETGEPLQRHDEPSPARGSVLTRLGHSHIRFGTFQRHAFERAPDRLEALVDHSLIHYYPQLFGGEATSLATIGLEERTTAVLTAVTRSAAKLTARWMMAGFVHGVLNTDNMNITGESFDYGPYRFLPTFEPGFTAAYFDRQGLYAFGRQPDAVVWNLSRLVGALGLLVDDLEGLAAVLQGFGPVFQAELRRHFFWHLGRSGEAQTLHSGQTADQQDQLMQSSFQALASTGFGFEAFFHAAGYGDQPERLPDAFASVIADLQRYPRRTASLSDAPVSLLYDEIEAIWAAIAERDDWQAFEDKIAAIRAFGAGLAGRAA